MCWASISGPRSTPVVQKCHMCSTSPPLYHYSCPFLPQLSLHLLAQQSILDPLLQLHLCLENQSFLMMLQVLTPSESVRRALLLPSRRYFTYNLELLESLLTSRRVLEDRSTTICSFQSLLLTVCIVLDECSPFRSIQRKF
jgi:hypothetical protein